MKIILFLGCVVLYLAYIQAQVSDCRGRPSTQNCTGGLDEGNNMFGFCHLRSNSRMWYYDSVGRGCYTMSYKGCGGNNNLFCSHSDCMKVCWRF